MFALATLSFRPSQLFVRLLTFLVWFACAAGMVYWVFKFMAVPPVRPLPEEVVVAMPSADRSSLERMLGMQAQQRMVPMAAVAKKLELFGVVAQNSATASSGAALIAVENGVSRPYRVGQTVVDGYVLQAIDHQRAVLVADDGRRDWVLDMPRDYQSGSGGRANSPNQPGSRSVSASRPTASGSAAEGRKSPSGRRS